MIFHSRVTDFCRDESDSGLSVKLVLDGCETYTIGNTHHHIRPGNFLLVNEHQQFKCRVRSNRMVEGLCIYLDPQMVRDIYAGASRGHRGMLELGGERDYSEVNFVEKIYSVGENSLGHFLGKMSPLLSDPALQAQVDFESFFMELAENLVSSQREIDILLGNLDVERASTKEEIFRRVSIARNYIEDNYLEEISLDQLAGMSFLSKYHFLRCFKQVYGQSPYQYLLSCRLEKGKSLLRTTDHSLTEIAYLTGFADRRAFNKTFRKAMGVSPGNFREQV